jgi:hypothetical protein
LFTPLLGMPLGFGYYFASTSKPAFQWFHWHPLMMMLAFVTFAGNGITIKKVGGLVNTRIHGNLMGAAWACAMFGGYVAWSTKDMYGKPHLTTPHGQCGAVVLGMLALLPAASFVVRRAASGASND